MDEGQKKREKRGAAMAAMGLVVRDGNTFTVSSPSLRASSQKYTVRRDESGRVVCDCLNFKCEVVSDAAFRCDHIYAVKKALLQKQVEAKPVRPVEPPGDALKDKALAFVAEVK